MGRSASGRRRRARQRQYSRLAAWVERLEERTLLASGEPIISEFLASNSGGLADEDGDHSDWIELYNPSASPVSLNGWSLTDDPDVPGQWHFPSVTLDPSGFLVVFASGKNRAAAGAELHTNFKLGASGDYLALDRPDGTVAQEFSPTYPPQTTNVSYGDPFDSTILVTAGAQADVKVPTNGAIESTWNTPGYSPDASWAHGPTGIGYGILQPGFNVRYVKANVTADSIATTEQVLSNPALQTQSISTSADTINYVNTGSGANFASDQPFPTQTIGVDIDNFVLDATGLVTIPTAGTWTFGVNSDDGFKLTLERNGQVLSTEYDSPRGPGDTIQVFNVPEPGQWNVHLEFFEQGGGAEVELFAAPGSHPSFDGGVFKLVGDSANGGLAVGSVLAEDAEDTTLVGRFVADDLNGLAGGSPVSSWTDRDPNSNGPVTAVAGGSPHLIKGAVGGHSAIRFDATDGGDQLRIAAANNPLAGAGDFSAALVFVTTSPGTGPAGDWWANAGLIDAEQPGSTEDWGMSFDAEGRVGAGIGNPDVSVYSQAGLNNGQAHVAVLVRSGGVLSIYVDGRLQGQREDASTLPRNAADLVFGSLQTDLNYYTGDIAEVRLYDNDLSPAQVQRLATELDATYNLPGVTPSAVGTDVRSLMQGTNSTAYIRIPFESPDPSQFDNLSLRLEYDDGFVAYLNGVIVAKANAPTALTYNSSATAARDGDPTAVATFSLTAYLNLLHSGTNLLAIRGLNASAMDGDFLILPELLGTRLHTDQLRYFATPTPDAPNGAPYLGLIAPVSASVTRGFFNAPFTVKLSDPTAGAQIRYTLDGSEPTATHGTLYTGQISVSGTTTLRAGAFESGYLASPTIAETYLFLDDIVNQEPDGSTPAGWPASWGNNEVDYGMDPDIVNSPLYGPKLKAALQAIPTISLTTDLGNLFDPATGIYANAYQQGEAWERAASVELINPDGTPGFQIDAGLRIRGGYSRSGGNPKHAFRLFFRGEYGASSLNFPLFGAEGTDSFQKVDLRTAQNYSWSFGGDPNNNFVAELFSRETMRDMGQPYTRSRFYQLYIDGQYWGLYQTEERPEANYAASYFGGDKDNYDVIKVETGPYTTQATDGNFDAWNRLWQDVTNPDASLAVDANYYKLLGKNPDGSNNPNYEVLVDADELVDFMIVILYGGNLDAPISAFLGNNNPNNFFAIRDRTGRTGFQFIIHDAEHTLLDVNENRNGPFPAGQDLPEFNPQFLHQQLMANANYRLKFADHVQKAFFNGGPLTREAAAARFQSEASQISQAIIGESARWGDAKSPDSPLTQADWQAAVNRVLNDYIPYRNAIVLDQFRANGLFPALGAPSFVVNGKDTAGGPVHDGDQLTLTAPSGTIYYTNDGTDPRLPNGAISPAAILYPGNAPPITLTATSFVTARAFQAGTWSPIVAAEFSINVPAAAGNLVVTEFDYHPAAPNLAAGELNVDREQFEFLELQNIGTQEISLSGVKFTTGIAFDFTGATITTLAPGAYVLIVKNPAAFASRYGTGLPVAGTYGGAAGGLASLSNSGERLLLVDASGTAIEDFKYGTKAPWPASPDGGGPSLVRINPKASSSDPLNWRASNKAGGNPGVPDTSPPSITTVADQTIAEDSTTGDLMFTVSDGDTPAGAIIVTVSSNNFVLLPPGNLVLNGVGGDYKLRATPPENAFGNATITVTATDSDGLIARMTFFLTVNAVDDPPAGLPESYVTNEDEPLSVTAALGVLRNDTDIEGDHLVAVRDQGPAHGSLTLKPDGSFVYTPALNYHGSDSFSYHPYDGKLGAPPVTVGLTINPVADPPALDSIPDKVVGEETTLTFTVGATDPDLPDDALTFKLEAGAPAGAAIDPMTGKFSWTPDETRGPGVYSITVTVSDGGSPPRTDSKTFSVRVLEVNRPPVLASIPSTVVRIGESVRIVVTASDPDLPANGLSYRLALGSPEGASVRVDTGVFRWTPPARQKPGRYAFTVSAVDNGQPGLSSSRTFFVDVTSAPAPKVIMGPSVSVVAGNRFSQSGRFTSTGPSPWTATIDYGDGSGTHPLAIASNHTFSINHVYASAGSYSATVRIHDGSGTVGQGILKVNVAARPAITITSESVAPGASRGTTAITVNFSGPVDSGNANDLSHFRLTSAGRDRKLGTRDDQPIRLGSAVYDAGAHSVTITTQRRLPSGIATLGLSIPNGSLHDSFGRPIDGNHDGIPGGDFFAVVNRRALGVRQSLTPRRSAVAGRIGLP